MKLVAGWVVSAGLVLAATSAGAQVRAPSDAAGPLEEPYGGMPPAAPPYRAPPRYLPPGAPYGYAPALMPPREVYAILRENGFLPLGIPHREGFVYEISAVDPNGEDGRLVIDGRTGRFIRFMPAPYWGGRGEVYRPRAPSGAQAGPPPNLSGTHQPLGGPPRIAARAVPPPPPKVATLPVPKAAELRQPVQKAADPVPAQAQASAAPPSAQPKPTQDMPPVQALE